MREIQEFRRIYISHFDRVFKQNQEDRSSDVEPFVHSIAAINKVDELCMVIGGDIIGKDHLRSRSVEEFYRSIQSWLIFKEEEAAIYKRK